MSIPLPPLPEPVHGFYAAPMYSPDQLRARDLEVARAVLEAAAKVCDRYTEGQWLAEQIRALEFTHDSAALGDKRHNGMLNCSPEAQP